MMDRWVIGVVYLSMIGLDWLVQVINGIKYIFSSFTYETRLAYNYVYVLGNERVELCIQLPLPLAIVELEQYGDLE